MLNFIPQVTLSLSLCVCVCVCVCVSGASTVYCVTVRTYNMTEHRAHENIALGACVKNAFIVAVMCEVTLLVCEVLVLVFECLCARA
jgi:hypothetical protein